MNVNKDLAKKILNGVIVAAGIITTADQAYSGIKNVKGKLTKKDNSSANKTEEV